MKNLNSGGNKSGKKTRLETVGGLEQYGFDFLNRYLMSKIRIVNKNQTREVKIKNAWFDNRGNIYITTDED